MFLDLCVNLVRHFYAAAGSSLHHITTQHRNIVSVTSCQASHLYSRCRAARALSLSLRSTVMFLYFLLHRITYVCKYVERMTRHILHINLYIIALPIM
jgi:hypothetical protein